MELKEVKQFLRVDFDEDDIYIKLLIRAAEEYVENAVDFPQKESPRYTLLVYFIVSSLYENRAYTVDQADEKVAYTIKSMLLQMQLGGVQ